MATTSATSSAVEAWKERIEAHDAQSLANGLRCPPRARAALHHEATRGNLCAPAEAYPDSRARSSRLGHTRRWAAESARLANRLRPNQGIRSAPKPIGFRQDSSMLSVYRASLEGILQSPTQLARRSSSSSINRWPTSFSEIPIR